MRTHAQDQDRQAQAQAVTRTLTRPCLDCGKAVRGKPRCRDCDQRIARAKAAKRPDMRTYAETERRRRLVADHRATVGDWCPGLEDHPAHPSADLVADHVIEVAIGGLESGPLRVLCRRENGRRSARVLDEVLNRDPAPAERPITHDDGPVVA
jgi:5-methylcytosine-specific restriction enzyme A